MGLRQRIEPQPQGRIRQDIEQAYAAAHAEPGQSGWKVRWTDDELVGN